jgi:cysteine synthase A
MAPENVNVYVKCEAFNPMGSVKDRLALGCIEVRTKLHYIVLWFLPVT